MNLTDRLANFEKTGQISPHPIDLLEIQQHVVKAGNFFADAQKTTNTLDTRFTVANSAGHQLLTAALKMKGYRTTTEKGHRAVLYDLLDGLVPGAAGAKGSLSRAHNARNKADYDGDDFDVTEGLVEDVLDGVKNVKEEVDLMFRQLQKAAQANANANAKNNTTGSPSMTRGTAIGSGQNGAQGKPQNKSSQHRGR